MPRKRSKYGRLNQKLKATGGQIPDDGEIKNYFDFLTGVNNIVQVNKVGSGAKKLYGIGLLPFAVKATSFTDASERYESKISLYAYNGLVQRVNAVQADFGIFIIAGTEQKDPQYFPALIKPSYVAESVDLVEGQTSAVTGRKYDYQYARTFSIPFGRTPNALDAVDGSDQSSTPEVVEEMDVLKHVRGLIFAGTDSKKPVSASYEPELFKVANETEALPDTLPTDDIIPVG